MRLNKTNLHAHFSRNPSRTETSLTESNSVLFEKHCQSLFTSLFLQEVIVGLRGEEEGAYFIFLIKMGNRNTLINALL